MSSARANVEITASSNRLSSMLGDARRKFSSFSSAVARGVGAAFGAVNKRLKLGETGKNAVGHMFGGLGERGIAAIADGANKVRDFERNLVRFGIAGGKSEEELAALRRQIRQISRDTAIADADILQGASAYVALTGDANGAGAAMTAFARIAQASGASVSEVATATAAMKTSLGLSADDIEAAFSAMIVQGKGGAVEVKDLAAELATLAPQFGQFRDAKSLSGIREMGAAFQTIMTGSGSAAEASTKFQALIGELSNPQNVKALAKLKIKVFDKDPKTGLTTMRNFSDIAEDLATNELLKDPRKLSEIFGRKEARQAIIALREHVDLFRQLKVVGEDTGAVQRDMMTFLKSDAGRLDQAINNLKVSIVEAFTPERIRGFVNAIEDLAEKVEPIVEAVSKMGDVLGDFVGVGKSVREFFSGNANNNPWGGDPLKDAADRNIAEGDGEWILTPSGKWVKRDSLEGKAQVTGAQLRLKHRKGWNDAVNDIMSKEVNERTSKASVAAAIAASHSDNIGTSLAGDRYLRNAGVSKEEQQKIVRESLQGMGTEMAKQIADAIKGLSFVSEIGSDKVVDATRKSQANRTRQ